MSTLQDPTDLSALVVSGGYEYDDANSQESGAILKLTCTMEEACKWQVLSHTLQVPRFYHVSFFTNKPLNCSCNDTKDENQDDIEDDSDEGTVDETDDEDQGECENQPF